MSARLAEVDVERLRELVTGAWLVRAPDALRGDLDRAGGSSSAELRSVGLEPDGRVGWQGVVEWAAGE